MQGTWDGGTLTYRGAIPAASHDPAAEPPASTQRRPTTTPRPSCSGSPTSLADTCPAPRPLGSMGSTWWSTSSTTTARCWDQVDRAYGDGVVVLVPQLVDVEG